MKRLYLLLAATDPVLPYCFFSSFLLENGLDLPLLMDQVFASDISTFFAVDLLITAIVLLIFSLQEARRHQMQRWRAYAVDTVAVGPSLSLPQLLYLQQSRPEGLASGA